MRGDDEVCGVGAGGGVIPATLPSSSNLPRSLRSR